MTANPFDRLAPFIREYIWKHQWTELHEVQVEACRVIFDTDAHLLLATGTASGKTEAAFLPVLTLLQETPSATVGVLYIGPLKALINDQFGRLEDLLKEVDIPVWHWHGDVSQTEKTRFIKKPRGVLQITPESLESMLINRHTDLVNIFGDLRFIVIDEVHAFMGSDRGLQVLCQLQRLTRFIRTQPRRIGLSATLGDYTLAEQWLQAGTQRQVIRPQVGDGKRAVHLAVEHFEISDDDGDGSSTPYYEYLYENSKARKCLIFANSRGDTETVTAALRQVAAAHRTPDIYHVHHGSISAPLREAAEAAMREPNMPAVVAATVTLELGIDIGRLERIIQLEAPFSVSSFVQRLGRSGRRGEPSEMWFVCAEERPLSTEPLPDLMPWPLLQCIAIIQLYLEERWIEPITPPKYPLSLLYHQTMSTLAGSGELSPAALAQRVLTLPPFKAVTEDDFRDMLVHLMDIDHIQEIEGRGLIVGLTGEKVVRNFRFYAVFPDVDEYSVRDEAREIGSITMPPPPGERFALAGRTWEVLEIDTGRRMVFVKAREGKARTSWHGYVGNIHTRIVERMRKVLFEDNDYAYLQPGARKRLAEARQLARSAGLDRNGILHLGGNAYCMFPWLGSVGYRTLERSLKGPLVGDAGISKVEGMPPYFLTLRLANQDPEKALGLIRSYWSRGVEAEELLDEKEAPIIQKYDEFLPAPLLRKAFATDCLNVTEVTTKLAHCT